MIRVVKNSRLVALAAMAACVMACAGPGAPPPPEPDPGAREPYVIGIPDILSVVVWRNPELSVEVPVRRDGKISVPLVDDVQAEGLTPHELKEVLTEALRRIAIRSPSWAGWRDRARLHSRGR
jgi:polysaccharide export outer membrane protein